MTKELTPEYHGQPIEDPYFYAALPAHHTTTTTPIAPAEFELDQEVCAVDVDEAVGVKDDQGPRVDAVSPAVRLDAAAAAAATHSLTESGQRTYVYTAERQRLAWIS